MATRGKLVPTKLKQDAIVEALFEIRFDSTTIEEVLIGRLADFAPWKEFQQRRLPAYEVPARMRQADPNLRYQPVFELLDPTDGHRAVRIGAQVLSYHQMPPYVGWDKFRPQLSEAIDGIFAKAEGLTVRRLGFRYVNALRQDVHGIRAVSELDLTLAIADGRVTDNVNINFTTELSEDTQCTVRIATTDFVQGVGVLPPSTSVVIDVDVFTKESFRTREEKHVKRWVEFAHTNEKEQFFRLLTDETIDALKEN
jgi:uncharacterized protein (TIGR04255 family)